MILIDMLTVLLRKEVVACYTMELSKGKCQEALYIQNSLVNTIVGQVKGVAVFRCSLVKGVYSYKNLFTIYSLQKETTMCI